MKFFEYKWSSDCNLQFNNEQFKYLVKVMPIAKKIEMFREYLFFMFCYKYQKYFMFVKEPFEQQHSKKHKPTDKKIRIMHAHYNWSDDTYIGFMMTLMNFLEPINFEKG